MTLPKIDKPLFDILVPSLKREVTFRPFVVREEKILLTAQQSGQDKDIILAIKQVIQNCVQDESINVNNLAIFDLEYIFLKLRARSVNNVVKLAFRDNDDQKLYEFDVDLEEVDMLIPAKVDNNIKITENAGIIMKYPSVDIVNSIGQNATADEVLDALMRNCIKEIYDADTVYSASEYTDEQLQEWINDLDVRTFEQVREFFEGAPRVYYKIEYTNANGDQRLIELNSLNDFFTWG